MLSCLVNLVNKKRRWKRMPAKSEKQARLFRMALAYKRGELSLSKIDDPDVRKKIKDIAERMSEEEIRKYAKKKRK